MNDEKIEWTPEMPDRRVQKRRDGGERRASSRYLVVPDMRLETERRHSKRRRMVRLTITGRAHYVERHNRE